MFRYVAISWSVGAPAQTETAKALLCELRGEKRWKTGLEAPDLHVLYAGERHGSSEIYKLLQHDGIVLGKLFHADCEGDAAVTFDPATARRIFLSEGRTLTEKYWGRYVAFLHDPATARTWVLRDPSGALPCYLTHLGDVRVMFSDVQDICRLASTSWSVNWQYIARRMSNPLLVREEPATGLNEILRVLPGECLELSPASSTRRRYWRPRDIIDQGSIENDRIAAEAIRSAARRSVWAWASCYPRVLHLLSGGFDSSVVLSCLRTAPSRPQVTCINYYGSTPGTDEREYARQVAQRYDCNLLEFEDRPGATRLEPLLGARRFAVPWSLLYYVEHTAQQGSLASRMGASAILAGVGGDQVFYRGSHVLAAHDFLHQRGLTRGFFRFCLDTGRVQGTSIWTTLSAAVRQFPARHSWTPLDDCGLHQQLVAREVIESVRRDEDLRARWVDLADGIPAGKMLHAHAMACGHEFYDPLGGEDYPERVRPLVSQPLVETCLRIPTYVLVAGGLDRAAARRAFHEDLPLSIVRRRTKGAADTHLARIFRSNLPFIRQLMLDGILVRERFLDRQKVEWILSSPDMSLRPEAAEIVTTHLSTEAWARGWAA